MKDKSLYKNVLSEQSRAALQKIADADRTSFSNLTVLAGLDRTRDLRHADLRGVDFSHSDLRGFDFTGADLRYAIGIAVTWDESTTFVDADLTGSPFAAKVRLSEIFRDQPAASLLRTVSGTDWSDQIIWVNENLTLKGGHNSIAFPVAEFLFYQAKDNFLKAELLKLIAPQIRDLTTLREVLLAAISDNQSALVVRATVKLFKRFGLAAETLVRNVFVSLLESPNEQIRVEAVRLIMRSDPNLDELSYIKFLAESGDQYIGSFYVSEIASRLGDEYDLVTRDPTTNSSFYLGQALPEEMPVLIARRWLRAQANREPKQRQLSLSLRSTAFIAIDAQEIPNRTKRVSEMWSELEQHGVYFRQLYKVQL